MAEVRLAIAALLGLDVKYADAASIIARYAELMAENAIKEAAKTKKAKKSKVKKSTTSTKEAVP